jgi:ribokinase
MKKTFSKVIGTGGIGTGEIYRLEGEHTLGREESRAGHLLETRDFCKLHIILHYVAVLTRHLKPRIQVMTVSAIGDDVRGSNLRKELIETGIDVKYIKTLKDTPTLHSICFQYPDGSGGNITESLSACSKVNGLLIRSAESEIDSTTILLAAPEVPLQTRVEFIKIGAEHDAFITASFTSSEMEGLENLGIIEHIDLLSINMDEARMFSGFEKGIKTSRIVEGCIEKLRHFNPDIKLAVTNGANGVYAFEDGILDFLPAYPVSPVNTAGAGDAFLAGLIIGIIKGLSIIGDKKDSGLKYATALSSMSVTSKDTIHFGITVDTLQEFMSNYAVR